MSRKVKDNRFIGAFVNEMYAILLGIGLGNVLFIQQIELTSLYEIVMGLFVTGVVLLYWWDWTEFISESVVSSTSEFIIDFMILICLEILFLFFNKPVNLAFVFLLISVFDFAWVVNYIYQTSGNFVAQNSKWIVEKVIALCIYVVLFISLYFFFPYLPDTIKGGAVVATFLMVRFVSFNQVKKAQKYTFCRATNEELNIICEINNSYLVQEDEKAFMITGMEPETLKLRRKSNYQYFVLKYSGSNEVLGFVELSPSVGHELLEKVDWLSMEDKKQWLDDECNLLYVEKIAVNPEFRGQKIGNVLYDSLFSQFQNYSFYAFVMSGPLKNTPSMRFHERNGFDHIGTFRQAKYNKFEHYESRLYFRKCK